MVEGLAQIAIAGIIVVIGLSVQYGLRHLRAEVGKKPNKREIGIAGITGFFTGAVLVLPQMSSLAWDPQNPANFSLLVITMIATVAGLDSITRKLAKPKG